MLRFPAPSAGRPREVEEPEGRASACPTLFLSVVEHELATGRLAAANWRTRLREMMVNVARQFEGEANQGTAPCAN